MAYKDSLVSWWELNEESGERADAHGSNNLTDNNTVLYTAGKKGNAARFVAAQNEFLDIADQASLSFADVDFTLACWARLDTTTGSHALISKWEYGNSDREYLLRYNSTPDRFQISVSNDGTTVTSEAADELGAPADDTWYFVVAWHDATANTLNIQVDNGTIDSGSYSNGCNDNISPFSIGAYFNSGTEEGEMDGDIDEAAVWGRVLTATEKTWLYNAGNGRAYAELDAFVATSTGIF